MSRDVRRATTHQVNLIPVYKMANSTALCKSEDFDSIDQIETTTDRLTGRAELALSSRYLRNPGLCSVLDGYSGRCGSRRRGFRSRFSSTSCFAFSGRDRLFAGSLRRSEGVGRLCRSDRDRSRIDGFLSPDQAVFLRVLSGANLGVSAPDPATNPSAASGPGAEGGCFRHGLDGLEQRGC